MKRILFTLTAVVFAIPALAASEVTTADKNDETPGGPVYELKRKSSFNLVEAKRSPFWPIGWVKRERGAALGAPMVPKFILDPKSFNVTSILLGSPALAVINGRAYEEGQFLRPQRPAAIPGAPVATATIGGPKVRVQRIADGQVSLQCNDQVITIPLRRAELGERKIEQELLSSERDEFEAAVPAPTVSAR